MQPDNLQLVHINGDDVTYRTIVVGALSAEGLSRTYWDEVESHFRWTQRLAERFHRSIYKLRYVALAALLLGFGFVAGLLTAMLWLHRRDRARELRTTARGS